MKDRLGRPAAALVALALVLSVGVTPALAASCDPQRSAQSGTWFAGSEETDFPAVTGIKSYVYESDVWVDWSLGNSPTSAWVMLTGSGSLQVAQIGWYEGSFNNRKMFDQTNVNGTFVTHTYTPRPEDASTTYQAKYEWTGSGYAFKYYANGTLKATVSATFDPTKSSVMGELKNKKNQMPGTSSVVQKFYNTYRRSGMDYYGNASWTLFYGDNAGTSDTTNFGFVYLGSGNTYIWDKKCS